MLTNRAVKAAILAAALALVAAACGAEESGTLTLGNVPSSVEGNVVSIPATIEGIEIVAPDGSTDETRGHFHVFIDRDPVDVGEVVPREAGIVHSAENPIKIYGLSVGSHDFTVVVGDGTHTRFAENIEESVTVDVRGPSVDGTASAALDEGSTLTVELASEGVEIRKADGDRSGDSGHYHVLVDPAAPPKAGELVPGGVENKIIHTTESSTEVAGLTKGDHVIWVVLGDGTHTAFDPPVMDRLMVTVS